MTGTFVAPTYLDEDQTDTLVQAVEVLTNPAAAVSTTIFDARRSRSTTFDIKSTCDQACTVQFYSDLDPAMAAPFPLGAAISVAAGNATPQYTQATLTDPHAYIKATVTPAAATTGAVTIRLNSQISGER